MTPFRPPGDAPQPGRRDGVALWRQIAMALEREITSAVWPPGARLPTEAALSQRFGVNRHTVRRGLEALSQSGLIRIEQGRGSFVTEDVMDYAVGPRTRFSEWIRRHNKDPSGQVLRLREMVADATLAAGLKMRAGGRVVLMQRLGLADDRPVSLTRHFFPAARLRGIMAALSDTATITEALARVGVGDYLRQATRVSARMPNAEEAALLRMPRNRPVLVCENTNVDRCGRVVEFGIGCYPTPRVQIVFEP